MTQCSESARSSEYFWPARRAFAESGPPAFRHGTGAASRGNATTCGGGELVDKASLLQSQHYKEALQDRTCSMSGAFGLYRSRSIGLRLGRQQLVAVAVILRLRRCSASWSSQKPLLGHAFS